MNEDEKQRVAYHESGHALVAYSLPNTDPVHKVSIIPRGLAALGYTMQMPKEDRYLLSLEPDRLLPTPDRVPERFEAGTPPFELYAGLAAAVDHLAGLCGDARGRRRSHDFPQLLLHVRQRLPRARGEQTRHQRIDERGGGLRCR